MGKNTAVLEKGHAKRSKKSRHGLTIVSFDSDFDRTERGRKMPKDLDRICPAAATRGRRPSRAGRDAVKEIKA